jgi:hypothetical protein
MDEGGCRKSGAGNARILVEFGATKLLRLLRLLWMLFWGFRGKETEMRRIRRSGRFSWAGAQSLCDEGSAPS